MAGTLAIKDEPRGFIPYGRILSTHAYAATASAVIAQGDLVKMSPTGLVLAATAGNTQLVGVAASYKKSTGNTVLVYDDPDQQYLVQDDAGGTTVLVSTHLGLAFDITATAANTTLLKSQHELDRDSNAYGAGAAQIKLLEIVSVTGANSLLRVMINEHVTKKTTGAI